MPEERNYLAEAKAAKEARIRYWRHWKAWGRRRYEAHRFDAYPEGMRGDTPADAEARGRYDAEHPRYVGGGNPYKGIGR